MSTATLRRLSRAERMERIAEEFRRSPHPPAANSDVSPAWETARNVAVERQPELGNSGDDTRHQRGWRTEAPPSRAGAAHRSRSDFTHVHRSLAVGEAIPPPPSLLEQIVGLSELLSQRPLSQQEEAALRGDEEQDLPSAQSDRDDAEFETPEEAEDEITA